MTMAAVSRDRAWWVRLYRLGFGLLIIAAVVVQLDRTGKWANFFSFFTIQSNLIGAAVLLIGAIAVPGATRRWDLVRGAAAIYLILTGVIYNTLLTGVDVQTSEAWINNVLHRIIPVVMLIDFLILPLAHRIRWREALVWSIYPLLYLAYSLIRGPIVDWYPYPFLDPREDGGYPRVAAYCVAILIGFLAVTWVMTEVNARRSRREA
ncbi:MAG: Pr6Pr family membrane protein [Thermomicrobiales bacterium]|nr:Pr6Pr family membrane protein [Thermomicrobiales bacterium]